MNESAWMERKSMWVWTNMVLFFACGHQSLFRVWGFLPNYSFVLCSYKFKPNLLEYNWTCGNHCWSGHIQIWMHFCKINNNWCLFLLGEVFAISNGDQNIIKLLLGRSGNIQWTCIVAFYNVLRGVVFVGVL
jgi:hypothetical protein